MTTDNQSSEKEIRLLKENLRSREWRLENLYWIKDKQSNRVKFKPNWAQKILLKNLWFLTVILKARQLGISTFFCILWLDEALFSGMDCGIIAHTLKDAEKIFETKVKYAWDNLPEVIRSRYEVNAENTRELQFKLDTIQSSIYVGTSLRSQTVQRLLVSELAAMDLKYPLKSAEIKSGAFNTVGKGQIIVVESTAAGQYGNFYDICSSAEDNIKMKRELTEMDWRLFFFAWFKHPEYRLAGEMVIPRELQDYFTSVELKTGEKLDREQRNWYFKKWQTQKDAMKTEYPSTIEEAFQANVEGAYYGKQMDRVMADGRITRVPYEPRIPVDTWWDLGTAKQRKDSMSIVFTQQIGLEIRVIDFYGVSGEGLPHCAKVLNDKKYLYGTHNAPHDIEVKEVGTGKTRIEMGADLGIVFKTVPNIGFNDGIEATRLILSKCWFDEEKTEPLKKALIAYRKAWDDRYGRFKDEPLKDWSSDPCDAFRMMAVGMKEHQMLGDYDEEEKELQEIKDRQALRGKYNPFNPFGGI